MPVAKTSQQARWKFYLLPGRLAMMLRTHGLWGVCRRGWRRLSERLLERKLGIQTVGSIDATALDTGVDSFGYQPIPYAALETALDAVDGGADDVFVDLGCGMGRAVIVAGLRSLRRVIGVEISAELCDVARRNVAQAEGKLRTTTVDIVEADAREYALPDDATILMLFNPFDEPVLRRALENVRLSLDRAPRTLTIVYAIPQARHDLLAEVAWLNLQHLLPIRDEPWLRLAIYRSKEGQ